MANDKIRIYIDLGGQLFNEAIASLIANIAEVVEINEAEIIFSTTYQVHDDARHLILTTTTDDTIRIDQFWEGQIDGLITHRATSDDLHSALQALAKGQNYIHPMLVKAVKELYGPTKLQEKSKLHPSDEPTPREMDVLEWIAKGFTNKQTAEKLGIGERTVESHRANLMSKLNLKDRAELVRYYRENYENFGDTWPE